MAAEKLHKLDDEFRPVVKGGGFQQRLFCGRIERRDLGNAVDQYESKQRTLAVKVNVDAGNAIRESNETNNVRWFDIEFQRGDIINLPLCNSPARKQGMTSLNPN